MWKCLCAILLYITFHSFIHSSVRLSSVSLKQQNSTAHLVLRVPKTDRISHPASLHWLPIYLWIQYKHASLCYCCLNLTELQTVYKPTHQSSSNTSILYLPFVCMYSLDQRPFSYAALSVWNSLPCQIGLSNTQLQAILLILSLFQCVCVHVGMLAEVCYDNVLFFA